MKLHLSFDRKATPCGLWLKIVLNLGGIASLITATIAMMLAQVRIFYGMAYGGLLPSIFGKVYYTTNTPIITTLICGN